MKIKGIIYMVLILFACCSCKVSHHLTRGGYQAGIEHHREESVGVRHQRDTANIRRVSMQTGEIKITDGSILVDNIVVVSPSRTIVERNGKVDISFKITVPKDIQGTIRVISITPYLMIDQEFSALEPIELRGVLFDRVVRRNLWQYQHYLQTHSPDRLKKEWAYNRFIKHTTNPANRLDSVVPDREDITYYYTQTIAIPDGSNKMQLYLQTNVKALDRTDLILPVKDTLIYNISSMLHFVDETPKYLYDIISKYVKKSEKYRILFPVGRHDLIDSIGDNRIQLDRLESDLRELLTSDEFVIDSLKIKASASPEGPAKLNRDLAYNRARSVSKYVNVLSGGSLTVKGSHISHSIADPAELLALIQGDSVMGRKSTVLRIIRDCGDITEIDRQITQQMPGEYEYIKMQYYPLLRSVELDYYLTRSKMEQDTIITTRPDLRYIEGMELLKNRRYKEAIEILQDYLSINTAVAYLSLGWDRSALAVLNEMQDDENTLYLKSITHSRLGNDEKALEFFNRACDLNELLRFRANLDPELYNISSR